MLTAYPPWWSALTTDVSEAAANPGYLAFHRPRFEFVLRILEEHASGQNVRILDVGPSPLTELIRPRLASPVDTLGLEPESDAPHGHHYRFDLNDAQERERWRLDLGPYAVIVFAEVIEHLYTAPELVLDYLKHLLLPGGLLILQTPNAVSLRKRVRFAAGINPFERIRPDRSNPGHFREYTPSEIRDLLSSAGFRVRGEWLKFYFDARYARHQTGYEPPAVLRGTVSNIMNRLLPSSLREGVTVLAERPKIAE
jgi:hypothetical protein